MTKTNLQKSEYKFTLFWDGNQKTANLRKLQEQTQKNLHIMRSDNA